MFNEHTFVRKRSLTKTCCVNLRLPDILIIVSYLLLMVMIGWLLRKKARVNKESYLLGGKKLPWYMLGLSNASDMFDISGTMWMIALCFVYGLKSIWIPLYDVPWNKDFDEFTQADKSIRKKAEAAEQCKSHHNIVRSLYTRA